jgi:hypothetical protein
LEESEATYLKTSRDLKDELREWNHKIEFAILNYENKIRHFQNKPPLRAEARVTVPSGALAQLMLYNWKIWTIRYCVSLDFIIETIFTRYDMMRLKSSSEAIVQFGLATNLVTGPKARQIVEEAVVKAYPNLENYRVAKQQMPPIPLKDLVYDTLEGFVSAYDKMMKRRQRVSVEAAMLTNTKPTKPARPVRRLNYRKV